MKRIYLSVLAIIGFTVTAMATEPPSYWINNNSKMIINGDVKVGQSSSTATGVLIRSTGTIEATTVNAQSIYMNGTLVGTGNGTGCSVYPATATVSMPLGFSASTGAIGALDLTGSGAGSWKFKDASHTYYAQIGAPASLAGNVAFTLPATAGQTGQALITDGSGVMSWGTVASGWVGTATSGLNMGNYAINSSSDINAHSEVLSASLTAASASIGSLAATSASVGSLTTTGTGVGGIQLFDSTGNNSVILKASATYSDTFAYTIAGSTPASGTVLTNDGANNLYFASPAAATIPFGTGSSQVEYSTNSYVSHTQSFQVSIDSATTAYLGAISIPIRKQAYAITITSVTFACNSGTVTGCNLKYSAAPFTAGTAVLTSGVTAATTPTGGTLSSSAIPANNSILLVTTGTSGAPSKFYVDVQYSVGR